MSGFRGNALRAVKLADAKGALGPARRRLEARRDTPYVPSPLLRAALLPQVQQRDPLPPRREDRRKELRPERLEGVPNVYASPVAADGRVYVAAARERGARPARSRFKVLATNTLDDGFDASPVAATPSLPGGSEAPLPHQRVGSSPSPHCDESHGLT